MRDPDRYEVLGEHGRGGLGVVSRARDKELGRDVAIKELLTRGYLHELRFAREAMITARLEHPGIVPVHEAGRWPDGTPFYAMKLVAGRPLRALIAERKTVDGRIELLHHVIAVADAIAYAHGQNIIHRDLKPANVIVGEFGETVVIDWGLAKDLSTAEPTIGGSSPAANDDQLTSVGSVLGTPAYMAPEQERGEVVDQRADVFAIGAMLWELCSLQKVPPIDLAQRHRLLRRAGIDRDLVVIIDKAIAPDPRGRYRDAGELASDLRAFKSGARIMARSYSLPAMLMHWTRRHRALAISAMAFIALVLVSFAALARLYRTSSTNAELALRNERVASQNAATAQERLVQSYVEQGRRALLDRKYHEALPYLVEAVRGGGDSPSVRFMLERAAQPVGDEILRIQSATPRMWSARFSCDGRRLLTSDDQSAQVSDAETGRLLLTLPHGSLVFRALYAPGCLTLITVGRDGLVKIWDSESGQLLRTLMGPTAAERVPYRTGAISPDGRMIAATTESLVRAHVWEASTGRMLMDVASTSKTSAMAFSQDSRWFAVAVGDEVRVADTRTWKVVCRFVWKGIATLSFDPAGARLATGTELGDVSIWSVPGGARVHRLAQLGEPIDHVTFSPDGQFVAATARRGAELLWRAESGQLHARLANHSRSIKSAEFDATSKRWLSGSSAGQVVVVDVVSQRLLTVLAAADSITDVHFSPSSDQVVGASLDGTVRVWNVSSPHIRWSSAEIGRDCGTDVTPERDGRFVIVGCTEHETRVWDTASDTLLATLPSGDRAEEPTASALPVVSGEGDLSAVARGNIVSIHELPGGRLMKRLEHATRVTTLRFSSHGHALVIGTEGGALVIMLDPQADEVWLPSSEHAVDVAAFLPDGRVVAVDAERRLTIFDVEHRVQIASLMSPTRVAGLRVSADGDRLITIPETITPSSPVLWNLRSPSMIARLEGHNRQVYSADFVHEDRDILTAGTDGSVKLWDGKTGKSRQTFSGQRMLLDATISPDRSTVVGAGNDGNLWFWDARSGALVWTLMAHRTYISAVHFQGNALISRGLHGDLARWELPEPSPVGSSIARFERMVRCGPVRFDEVTGTLKKQVPSCPGPQH